MNVVPGAGSIANARRIDSESNIPLAPTITLVCLKKVRLDSMPQRLTQPSQTLKAIHVTITLPFFSARFSRQLSYLSWSH